MIYSSRFDIGIQEWRIIANLGNKKFLSANEIGEHVNLDKVQMSRAISKLMKKGLVKRTLDKIDKRKSSLRLSAKGLRLYEEIVPMALQREKQLLTALSRDEQLQFETILCKLECKALELNSLPLE
ncbi:MAG: MarR family transcriptional regulator [Sedimenticola sp.]|nr:MarR family transcriptional regulator [Sedimenticola sp.]MCW8881114.1 MarR family transcriptional regulator [Sedimenticola sp.]MCW8949483.1 MarR family transcriptional regulator [Sedimenticola sp.]MDF1529166.1 MarR family transcriptional regulator [Sedimenticola sp.]